MDQPGLNQVAGELLRRARQDRNLTQKEVADRAGVIVQTVRHAEKGTVQSSRSFGRICAAIGVNSATIYKEARDLLPGGMHPAVGRLTLRLMNRQGWTVEDLAKAMKVDIEDAQGLLEGERGPLYWGAAAVAFGVAPEVFQAADTHGVERAESMLESRGAKRRSRR